MNNQLQLRIQNEVNKIIKNASDVEIVSNVAFNDVQLALLKELNYFAATQALQDDEVERDPRKILYKTNQNFKQSLVTLCLTQVLINKRSKGYYTKEYFEANIEVRTIEERVKQVNFGRCEEDEVLSSINEEKVFDWILYCQGRGIEAFVSEKTNCLGLKGFVPGSSKTYEFARFERLYNEAQRRKIAIEKEKLQQEFKQTFMKELATGLAKQQIENNTNVLELVSSIFEKENYLGAIDKLLNNHLSEKSTQDKVQINNKILDTKTQNQLLTYDSNDYTEGFIQYVKQQNQHQR